MPAVIELRLQPTRPVPPGFTPHARQLHGLACTLFEGDGTGHENQEKPWTIWPLCRDGSPSWNGDAVNGGRGRTGGASGEAGVGWLFRGAWLRDGFPQQVLAACGVVRVGPVDCAVTDIAFRPATHAELADVPPVAGARVTLLSPAYFSQNGKAVTEPDVRMIVGSWRRRWNASLPAGAGLIIDADLWRDIHLALHVTGSGLQAESRDTGYKAPGGAWQQRHGLTGTLTLRLESGVSGDVRQAFGALARFAEYCGTGAQVTHAFGATRTTLLHADWSNATTPPKTATSQ